MNVTYSEIKKIVFLEKSGSELLDIHKKILNISINKITMQGPNMKDKAT